MNDEYLTTLEANLAASQRKREAALATIRRLAEESATTRQAIHAGRVRRGAGKRRLAEIDTEIEVQRDEVARLDLALATTQRTIEVVRLQLGLDSPGGA